MCFDKGEIRDGELGEMKMCSFDSLFRLREKVAELDWNDNGNAAYFSRDWTLIKMDLAMFS